MKLARNDTFGNKEKIKRWYLDTRKKLPLHLLDNAQLPKYLFSALYIKTSSISHYTSYGLKKF